MGHQSAFSLVGVVVGEGTCFPKRNRLGSSAEKGGSLSKHNVGWWGGYWWFLAAATVGMALMGGLLSEASEPGLARAAGGSHAAAVSARKSVVASATHAGAKRPRIQDVAAQ